MSKPALQRFASGYSPTINNIEDIIDDELLENEYLLKLAKSQMIDDDDDETITGDELIAMLRK